MGCNTSLIRKLSVKVVGGQEWCVVCKNAQEFKNLTYVVSTNSCKEKCHLKLQVEENASGMFAVPGDTAVKSEIDKDWDEAPLKCECSHE